MKIILSCDLPVAIHPTLMSEALALFAIAVAQGRFSVHEGSHGYVNMAHCKVEWWGGADVKETKAADQTLDASDT